jgi:hypothetical protein
VRNVGEWEAEDRITWRDERGRLVRCTPPPDRTGITLERDELIEWAQLWDVPLEAALRWYEQPSRPPAWLRLSTAESILEYAPRFLGAV